MNKKERALGDYTGYNSNIKHKNQSCSLYFYLLKKKQKTKNIVFI